MDVIFLSHVIVLVMLMSNMGTINSKGQAQSMTLPDDEGWPFSTTLKLVRTTFV